MPKYIFISGGVISGLGKGITSGSIGLLLKNSGYSVTPVKCENYLNLDAGTINPIEHGDVFLCEDGTEADMDIGSYEKFLDQNMGAVNFITMGQIYKHVIDKERKFEYDGEDVEAIPHITEEIIRRIQKAQQDSHANIVLIELGGTVGEYQNVLYYEAARLMTQKYPGNVLHIHVSYVPNPPHLGEPKTKPTQLSVRTLNSLGITPDIIIARSVKPLDKRRRERLSLFCNVEPEDVLTSYDVESVYEIPLILESQNITKRIADKLSFKHKRSSLTAWKKLVKRIKSKKAKKITIAIVGKYFTTGDYQLRDSYAALFDAIDHASWNKGVDCQVLWIDAERVEQDGINKHLDPSKIDGIIVPIGWGSRGAEGMIAAASFARKLKIPYLGLCYGMQLAAIAFARDVLGLNAANTTENNPETPHPVVHLMPAQEKFMKRRAYGGTMRLGSWEAIVKKGTLTWQMYDAHNQFINKSKGLTSERHRHRYEFNNAYIQQFEKAGCVISARSRAENLVEIIELDRKLHPFYVGTQGHPEYKSRPIKPHPVFLEFIQACIHRHKVVIKG